MLRAATQSHRELAIFTPLGKDKLLLHSLSGREELSQPFHFELEMLSADEAIDPGAIVGRNVSFRVARQDGVTRWFNGYVSRFGYVGQSVRGIVYRATLVPWLWFLQKTADCRIFQNKTAVQIIQQIFQDLGFQDFEVKLHASYPEREYCVQYRETDFAFVSRLMEEEGIFYYFRHENGKHTLVLADRKGAYFDLEDSKVEYRTTEDLEDRILSWEHFQEYRPGRWAQTDYDFKQPRLDLMSREPSTVHLPRNKQFEIYDYPGNFTDRDGGKKRTRVRMEEHEVPHDVASGSGTYRTFSPGGKFKFQAHECAAEVGKSYVVTSIEHQASVDGSYVSGTAEAELPYRNRFTCMPSSVVYRPSRQTLRPIVEGPQTAVIVGPPGEEIYPDEYGRVKVQFHWDREGKRDENSSCWIRVSQIHAGKGWGYMDLPRIGEEVIVDFLEGDPDRPIITGRVYNADNMPPFALPAGKTRRGNATKTYKGAGFNEMSMDDTPGAEQIRIHGQYNMDTVVENNQTLVVGVDRASKIGSNDTTEIGNNSLLKVGVDSTEIVGNNKVTQVGNAIMIDAGTNILIKAGTSITLQCGASIIHMNQAGVITIAGTLVTMAAKVNANVTAPLTLVSGAVVADAGILRLDIGAALNMVTGGVTSIDGAPVKINS
jgi:type VI secretion system secreted protein VgrG